MQKTWEEYKRWRKETITPIGEKGKQWYRQINERHNLEVKERGKWIAIDVETGGYVVAENEGDATTKAREQFGAAPLFVTRLLPYYYQAFLRVIVEAKDKEFSWFDEERRKWLHEAVERIYEVLRLGLERHYHGKYIALRVDTGEYVVADSAEKVFNRAVAEFPTGSGCGFYRVGYGMVSISPVAHLAAVGHA